MPELHVLIGLPGSGKSRHATSWVDEHPSGRVRINYDLIRLEMYGPDWKFNHKEEAKMKVVAADRAYEALSNDQSVMIDNTNLNENARANWLALADQVGATYREHRIDTSIEECISRDAKRAGIARVGRAVIERMALWNGLIDFGGSVYPQDLIIVDMDGTLADCQHRRIAAAKPYKHAQDCPHEDPVEVGQVCMGCRKKAQINWGIFYEDIDQDPVIQPIMDIAEILSDHFDIIVVSGRPINEAGKATEDWLGEHASFSYRHLFMRNGGDSRPDYVVKEEILDKMISSGLDINRIRYVLDDRPQVLRMWMRRGLTTLAVGPLEEF